MAQMQISRFLKERWAAKCMVVPSQFHCVISKCVENISSLELPADFNKQKLPNPSEKEMNFSLELHQPKSTLYTVRLSGKQHCQNGK
jgi:hypothetical protein